MPTKRKKRRACGPTNGGIEREFAKKSRLAGRHKTVKAGLEATIKCEKQRKIDRFCDLFDPYCAHPAWGMRGAMGQGLRNRGGDVAWGPGIRVGVFQRAVESVHARAFSVTDPA